MKRKEQYTKAAIAGSTFQIDMEASVNEEKQKEMRSFIRKYRKDNAKGLDVSKKLTQNFYYSKMLRKRRLDSLGVTIRERFSINIFRLLNTLSALWLYDGKNVACNITDEDGKRRKVYFISGNKKLSIKDKRYLGYSIITNASGTSEKVKCSNCGHECLVTSFFTGCDFCRTKFNIDDFDNRISSIAPDQLSDLSSGFVRFLMIIMFILTIWANIHFGFFGGDEIIFRIVIGLLLYFPVMIVFMILLLPIWVPKIVANTRKHAIGKKMEKYDKYFSREHFFGIIDSRLSLWAFSDKQNPLLRSVNNICLDENQAIDMDVLFYRNMLLKEEAENLIINCICNIRLVYLRGNSIQKDIGKYKLTFVRNKQIQTDLNFSLQNIKCKSCGASINLLDSSGICQSCRTAVNLVDYDWVMTEIVRVR
ncbi:MAG: hypothetical protein FWD05_08650 [Oscillospiraceae bacterium]|nr:hypothetical protein [Oscillospiraceae bacterium]